MLLKLMLDSRQSAFISERLDDRGNRLDAWLRPPNLGGTGRVSRSADIVFEFLRFRFRIGVLGDDIDRVNYTREPTEDEQEEIDEEIRMYAWESALACR